MKKRKKYKYIGRNGIIVSSILLDGINYIPMLQIESSPGFILTNGEINTYATIIEEDDLPFWEEIVDNSQKK